ncbi:MAG: GumC family protein [Desulfotalea sp.]
MKTKTSLRDFLSIFFKYKQSFFIVWFATIITVLIGNELATPIYEVDSPVMINFGREYVYKQEVGSSTPYNYYNRAGLINAEIEILSSVDLLKEVVQHVGVETLYPPSTNFIQRSFSKLGAFLSSVFSTDIENIDRVSLKKRKRLNDAVNEFKENFFVVGNKESNIIRIIFQHKNPALAARSLNYLIAAYQKKHLALFRDKKVSGFLEEMVVDYKMALENSENQLKSFKNQHAAFAVINQEDILVQQRGTFDTLWKQAQSETAGLQERLSSLEKQKQSMSASTPIFSETKERDRVIDNTKSELLSLQLKEQELLNTYKSYSPQVKNVRRRIQTVLTFLKEQESKTQATVRMGKSSTYQELELQIAITKADFHSKSAQSNMLEKKLEEIDDALKEYMMNEHVLHTLIRQKMVNEKNYLTYVEKLEDAKINQEMDNKLLTNIRIVHEAYIPFEPIKPKKLRNLIVGILLGALAGLGIAFFKSYFSQEVNSTDTLERHLKLLSLAAISSKQARQDDK